MHLRLLYILFVFHKFLAPNERFTLKIGFFVGVDFIGAN